MKRQPASAKGRVVVPIGRKVCRQSRMASAALVGRDLIFTRLSRFPAYRRPCHSSSGYPYQCEIVVHGASAATFGTAPNFSAPVIRHNGRENGEPFPAERGQQGSRQVHSRSDREKDIMPVKVHVAVADLHPELRKTGIDVEVGLYGARSKQVETLEVSRVVDEEIRAGLQIPGTPQIAAIRRRSKGIRRSESQIPQPLPSRTPPAGSPGPAIPAAEFR